MDKMHRLNILLCNKKFPLFLIFCILYIWLIFADNIFELSNNVFYEIIFPISAGVVISFIFYFFVVFLPERERQKAIKNNFKKIYRNSKKNIIFTIIFASNAYEGKNGGVKAHLVSDLLDVKVCKEYFSGEDGKVYFNFLNKLSSDNTVYEDILKELRIISTAANFFLNNYSTLNESQISFIQGIELVVLSHEGIDLNSDEIKPFSQLIYQLLTGYSLADGVADKDIVEEIIDSL